MSFHKKRILRFNQKTKFVILGVLLAAAVTLSAASLGSYFSNFNQNSLSNSFSIVQITDTQFLSQAYPAFYNNLDNWIVNNSQALNLMMVVHTGDIVNIANVPAQWANANNATMIFYKHGIPYCWNCGNHDDLLPRNGTMIGDGDPDTSWLGGNYPAFNVTIMRQEPYWIGDIFDGKSTAVQFHYSNYHFMIINVEYNANQTTLDWMQTLIKSNPNVNVIVATHNFLNGNGTYGTKTALDVTWATNFKKILNNYPNVFMTVNGHDIDYGPATNVRFGKREEIFFNRQGMDNQYGAATARIYTFDLKEPSRPIVIASTYQTYGTPHYLTDSHNQFNFSTTLVSYSPSTVKIAAGTDFVGASGYGTGFASPVTLNSLSQKGDTITLKNLTLNGVTSNLTVSSVDANIVISCYNPARQIAYMVSGHGTQTFLTNAAPASVAIDGKAVDAGSGWSYSNGVVTVTDATSSVKINFT
jgi:hypothetical protein